MTKKVRDPKCQIGCWAMAAGAGLVTFIMLLAVADYHFIAAVVLSGLVFGLLGLLLDWLFCTPLPALGETPKPGSDRGNGKPEPATAQNAAATAGSAGNTSSTVPSEPAQQSSGAVKVTDGGTSDASSRASSDTATANESAEVAEPEAASGGGEPTSKVQPSKPLAGQDDLAARKGEWRYEGADDAASKAEASPAKVDAASPSTAGKGSDYDGDGKAEGADEGQKPATLTQARDGGADDLKRIKGIGPKLEQLCNRLGFYHFDQVASWTPDEVAWVNANLEGFKGRVSRDNWVDQAKLLAGGGETEFSKRVDDGDVY